MKSKATPRVNLSVKLSESPGMEAEGKGIMIKNAGKRPKKPSTDEIGAAGNSSSMGVISDDFNSDFQTGNGQIIFEKMKRTDPMVRATMEAVARPILAAGYNINPASDDPVDIEIADFVEDNLENMEKPFCELLEEILEYPFMGFSYFEKVFEIVDGMIRWKKWASRMQTAHYRWKMTNGEPGVTQMLPSPEGGSAQREIPMDKLVLFVYKQKGENYDGFPLLRSAYRSWDAKDILYRIQLISMERAAGVLHIELPEGATEDDVDDAEELGENFRVNEQTFIVSQQGWKIDLLTNGLSEKMARIEPEIEHHNRMIALNILAQFMTLTSGDGGSNALSKDQSSFFTLGLRAIAKQIASVVNTQIKELVRYNWGDRDDYPEMSFNQIGQVDYSELANALSTLASSQLIEVTPEVKQTVHSTFNLPAIKPKAGLENQVSVIALNGAQIQSIVQVMAAVTSNQMTKEAAKQILVNSFPQSFTEQDVDAMLAAAQSEGAPSDGAAPPPDMGDGGEPVNPGSGEPSPDQQAEADDLLAQLDDLEGMLSEVQQTVQLASRGPMPEEVKKKISEALKKGGSADDEDKYVKNFTKVIENVKTGISDLRDQIKALRESGKGMDKATKAKIKEQVTAMRDQVKGMLAKKKEARDKLSARKAVLRLQRATAKASEKMRKLKERQLKIAEKQKELMGKIKFEKDKEKQAKLRERLDEMNTDATDNETAQSDLDTIIRKLLRTQKEVGLSEEQEEEYMVLLSDPHECKHGMRLAEFKPFRPLTSAEKRVKFASFSDYMNKAQERIVSAMAEYTQKQKDEVIAAVTRAVEQNDIRGLKELAWKGSDKLKKQLRQEAVNALEFGKSQAAGEIGVTVPSTPSANTQILDTNIDQMIDERNVNLMGQIKSVAMAGIAAGAGLTTIIYNVKQAFDSKAETYNGNVSGLLAGNAINAGRNLVFWDNSADIAAIQRSEILDSDTCAMCLTLDGRVMDVDDPFANLEEVHTNCRGINVAVLKKDAGDMATPSPLPSYITNKFETVEGVPMTNNFTQLKKPVVKKDSRLQTKIDEGKIEDNPNL